jgi:hypothetical protein
MSGVINELALRLAGAKGYVSTVALVVVPIAFLASGVPFKALRHKIGVFWALVLVGLCCSTLSR